jgi:hypothetical protein
VTIGSITHLLHPNHMKLLKNVQASYFI